MVSCAQTPDPDDPNAIRAVTTEVGRFAQETTASLLLKTTDFEGNPFDPEEIHIKITDPDGKQVELDNNVPFKATQGFYVYDWFIEKGQKIGQYTATWMYVVNGETRKEVQSFTVSAPGKAADLYAQRLDALRGALERYIIAAQRIPVYFEQARFHDRNRAVFTFPRWNQTPGVRIYRNKNQIITKGLEVDYFKGEVFFDSPLTNYDIINADYNFKWFSDEDLGVFLINAVNAYNHHPPFTQYSVASLPVIAEPGVLYKAATDAIRELIMSLMFQEPEQVFGGPDRAQQIRSDLESLKGNYEREWNRLFDEKKRQPYPQTRSIVVPEFTLPGGRSLSPYTQIYATLIHKGSYENFIFKDEFIYEEVESLTLIELYNYLHVYKYNIKVLSERENGDLILAPVGMIFNSGKKEIVKLITDYGFSIDASEEHLFYSKDRYYPLSELSIGDSLVVYDKNENSVFEDRIFSINHTGYEIEMYDLDIPSTRNLFANDIKCHNSRWFRFLFSSGV